MEPVCALVDELTEEERHEDDEDFELGGHIFMVFNLLLRRHAIGAPTQQSMVETHDRLTIVK